MSQPEKSKHCAECGKPMPEVQSSTICPACLLIEVMAPSDSLDTADAGAETLDALDTVGDPANGDGHPDPMEGSAIGQGKRYKILQRIGEGGFGSVYMAEQSEPVRRRVAIKILKAGMDTRQVVARFEAERQALAMVDHPNIARVFDGGETEQGRPYFVMELVRGTPITAFCDREALSTKERLALFLKVCRAVQHAHQKGIIHRDLKPGNILVTVQDGTEPVPKVIDFGVAKAMETSLTDKTLFTRFEQMIGTPAYMSPEQAGSDAEVSDVDTRADIYALGVLLYELLTGTTPIEAGTLQKAAFGEVRRILREEDAPRPSARLGSLEMERRTSIAKERGTEAGGLGKLLRGDLDWIVMKAIEKDRKRRYETANALAEDVEKHLENEPVSAGPPTFGYRALKYLQRHRLGVATGVSIATALLVGGVMSLLALIEAHNEGLRADASQLEAEREARVSAALNEFFREDVLGRANPYQTIDEKDITLREAVDRAAANVEECFKKQPVVLASIHDSLTRIFDGMSDTKAARKHAQLAVNAYQDLYPEEHPKTISAKSQLAGALASTGDLEAALDLHRWVLKAREATLGSNDAATLRSARNVASLIHKLGDYEEGERLLRETLAAQERILGETHGDTMSTTRELARILQDKQRDTKEVIELMTRQLKAAEIEFGEDSQQTVDILHVLAPALSTAGRREEAERMQRKVVDHRLMYFGEDHHSTLSAMNNLAANLVALSRLDEAVDLYRRVVTMHTTERGEDNPATLTARQNLGKALYKMERYEEAFTELQRVLNSISKVFDAKYPMMLSTQMSIADCQYEFGNLDQCIKTYAEIVPLTREVYGASHPESLLRSNNLAFYLDKAGKLEEAEPVWRELCISAEAAFGPQSPKLTNYLTGLAWNLRGQKRWKDAIAIFQRVEKILCEHLGPDHLRTLKVRLDWLSIQRLAGTPGAESIETDREFLRLFNKVYGANRTLDDLRKDRAKARKAADR